jgi:hypothetical protein
MSAPQQPERAAFLFELGMRWCFDLLEELWEHDFEELDPACGQPLPLDFARATARDMGLQEISFDPAGWRGGGVATFSTPSPRLLLTLRSEVVLENDQGDEFMAQAYLPHPVFHLRSEQHPGRELRVSYYDNWRSFGVELADQGAPLSDWRKGQHRLMRLWRGDAPKPPGWRTMPREPGFAPDSYQLDPECQPLLPQDPLVCALGEGALGPDTTWMLQCVVAALNAIEIG